MIKLKYRPLSVILINIKNESNFLKISKKIPILKVWETGGYKGIIKCKFSISHKKIIKIGNIGARIPDVFLHPR